VLSSGVNDAGIQSVVGDSGGLGTTVFHGGQKSSKAVLRRRK
jgi:hypothetical protein